MTKKKDIYLALVSGTLVGLLLSILLSYLGTKRLLIFPVWILLPLVPVLFTAGIILGGYLSRRWQFFYSFSKFVAVGFLSAAMDNSIVTLLIVLTGVAKGAYFPFVRAGGIVVAIINSYIWNKYWAFNAGKTSKKGSEFIKFLAVTFSGMLTNIVLSYLVVSANPLWGLDPKAWANIAAVVGSAGALLVNFTGYRRIVFKPAKLYDTVDNVNK
ncbi:MAG: hypothetical protein CEN90_572 [Parcubacteria group bacterium Licking1014_17]|nr:MAG: hypothetical protein CEN90_572 [Parcubacteria group bacterium Licking1014_17]